MPLSTFHSVSGTLAGTTDALLISSVSYADLNGDGYSDLIIAGGSSPNEGMPARQGLVYFGDGKGGFALADQAVFPWQTIRMVATSQIFTADFNGDGRPDVFIAGFGKDGDPFPGEQNRLYLSTVDGRWIDATSRLPQLADNTSTAAIGDVNGDGTLDIYVGDIPGRPNVLPYLLLNDGKGNFTQNTSLIPAGAGQLLDYTRNGLEFFTGSALADLDGDGRADLILGAFGGNTARTLVLWNTGSGYSSDVKTSLPPGLLPDANRNVLDIKLMDFNRDGRPDIVMLSDKVTFAADYTATFLGWTLDIYLNGGNRTFTLATSQFLTAAQSSDISSTSAFPTSIDLIDFNRDGARDIVFVLEGGGSATTPYVLLNDNAGGFQTITRGDLSSNNTLANRPVPIVGQDGVGLYAFDVRGGQISYVAAVPTHRTTDLADFNGDGSSDILWRNTNGTLTSWQMTNGGTQIQPGASFAVDPSWKVIETLDWNGDGRSDILWRNTNGQLAVWNSTGSSFAGAYADGSVGSEWRIAGAGDYDGDGKGDIFWQNRDGSVAIWKSTGTAFQGVYFHASVGASWKVEGVGDFNGDGKADILWRNDNGQMATWLGTGGAFNEGGYFNGGVPSSWHIDGIGDFNGDGKDDILWRNDNGALSVWRSNGSGFDQGVYNTSVGNDWQIAQVGDYNGDGRADILWRNGNGAVTMWQSNGTGFNQSVYNSAAPTSWTIMGHDFPL